MRDLLYAVRMFRNNKRFTVAVIAVLSLGIGATTAIFSLADAVVLRPLPYLQPERLVAIEGTQRGTVPVAISPADFEQFKTQSRSLGQLAAYSGRSFNVTSWEQPERIQGAAVSSNFFSLFGVQPLLGRPAQNQLIISAELWARKFARSPGIVGSTLRMDGEIWVIGGVMPAGFQFPERAELWTVSPQSFPDPPVRMESAVEGRGVRYLGLIGRLQDGFDTRQAGEELRVINARLGGMPVDNNERFGVRLTLLSEEITGRAKPALLAILGAVIALLLITCLNVASLLLGRAIARNREFKIRMALGAGALRIFRQLLMEHVLLALAAGGTGILLANYGIRVVLAFCPPDLPRLHQVALNGRVALAAFGAAALCAIVFGLAPMLQTARVGVAERLIEMGRDSGEDRHGRTLRKVLVTAEVAISFALLAGAGFMLRSFYEIRQVRLGFDPRNVWTMQIALPRIAYADPDRVSNFYTQVVQRMEAVPGVTAVGIVSRLPLSGAGTRAQFSIRGTNLQGGADPMAELRMVSPGYFRAMSIPLLSGRWLADSDANGPPVALLNEAAARNYWRTSNPMDARISLDGGASWVQVVGVIRDVRSTELLADASPEIYVPYFQMPWNNMTVVARLSQSYASLPAALRQQVFQVDKLQPVFNEKSLSSVIDDASSVQRFSLFILTSLASMAVLLSAVGMYGVMANAARQRVREFGIRAALGLPPAGMLKMMVREGMMLACAGWACGLALAYPLVRSISSLLFRAPLLDPLALGAISTIVIGVAAATSLAVGRQVARVNPIDALRDSLPKDF